MTRAAEARELIDYAAACGAKALVLVPVNDGSGQEDGVRQENLKTALKALKPMLDAADIMGLVEPLGFEICSLRSKTEAADAIEQRLLRRGEMDDADPQRGCGDQPFDDDLPAGEPVLVLPAVEHQLEAGDGQADEHEAGIV